MKKLNRNIIGLSLFTLSLLLLSTNTAISASDVRRTIDSIFIEKVSSNQKKYKKTNCKKSRASFYKRCFGTCETASGEWFYPNKVSAAHKYLPFGTVVSVKNLNNGKTIRVKINDRGPFVSGRALDLSLGAMKKLNGVSSGVIPVEYCIIKT